MPPSFQVTFDCADPAGMARFWAAALGYEVQGPPEDGWSAIVDPAGGRPRIYFQRVPEPKQAKNRVHLDVNVGRDQADAQAQRLEGLGATKVGTAEEHGEYWVVMRDPEGNEFCLQ